MYHRCSGLARHRIGSYFKRWGWFDLIGGVPNPPILHLARIGRVLHALRARRTGESQAAGQEVDGHRGLDSLLLVLFPAIVVARLVSLYQVSSASGDAG